MFPRFKYLSAKLFSPKSPDHDSNRRSLNGSYSPVRTQAFVGEVITMLPTGILDNHIKGGSIVISSTSGQASGSFFAGASNFALNNPIFIDNSQTTNYFVIGSPVLSTLKDAGTPEAAMDSAARGSPSRCYPGSRKSINGRLEKWLLDISPQRKVTWLFGPTGVGKSTIAQTFGELALGRKCLGAAFFSGRFNELPTDPFRIIPTLAYQLSIRNPSYQQLIAPRVAGDPSILDARLDVQFRELIIQPFLQLNLPDAQPKTCVIILDGLDECEDEAAQCELIELINNAAQRNDLPLIWLLCSRPESHIKYTFSQSEFVRSCDREELMIDDEARADVERFLQETFKEIHKRYRFAISVEVGVVWPPKDVFTKISNAVSGYFVFASAVTRVVGDRIVGDPEAQLSTLLRLLQGLEDISIRSPFEALDIFYTRILSRVPERLLPTAIKILGVCAREQFSHRRISSAEQLWLFLRIDKTTFFYSMEKLHSVVNMPAPEGARKECPSVYHKSFADYLKNRSRSGEFFITDARVKVLLGVSGLHWYNHIVIYSNRKLVEPDEYNQSQEMLRKWFLGQEISKVTLMHLGITALWYFTKSIDAATESDTEFFDALREFNFGLVTRLVGGDLVRTLMEFVHIWDWSQTAAGPNFVRTEAVDESVDRKLLDHLSILTNGKPVPPLDIHEPVVYRRGAIPLPWNGPQPNTTGYVMIGRGVKSGLICWYQEEKGGQMIILNSFVPPSRAQITQYREWEGGMNPDLNQDDPSTEARDPVCSNQ